MKKLHPSVCELPCALCWSFRCFNPYTEVFDPFQFDFFFLNQGRGKDLVSLFSVDIQLSQLSPFVKKKKISFLKRMFLVPFSRIRWLEPHGFISGSPFFNSVSLLLCRSHAVFVIVALLALLSSFKKKFYEDFFGIYIILLKISTFF